MEEHLQAIDEFLIWIFSISRQNSRKSSYFYVDISAISRKKERFFKERERGRHDKPKAKEL